MLSKFKITALGDSNVATRLGHNRKFETLDRILYVNVNVKIFSLMDPIYHYF